MEFLNQIAEISSQISELEKKREELVESNSKEILNKVFKMMDWKKENLSQARIEYSSFERRIMIEVWLKNDSNARYVFTLGKSGNIQLKFREDFSLF